MIHWSLQCLLISQLSVCKHKRAGPAWLLIELVMYNTGVIIRTSLALRSIGGTADGRW